MSDITRLFGNRANAYASFRPQYPRALFTWLAEHSPAQQRALDIACGTGQASRPLLEHFQHVLACDGSPEQLLAAKDLHWFATPAFFAEATRLLKPNGLFCAWCYSLLRIDSQLDTLLDDFYWNTLGGYWPAGRSSVDAGYRDIHAPFARIEVPAFAIELEWDLAQLLGYLSTWSAVQKLEQASGRDPLQDLLPELQETWGEAKRQRFVRWPLHFLAGRPNLPHQ